MADDTNPAAESGTAADVTVPEKKKRAPRTPKVAKAASASAPAAKARTTGAGRGRKKETENPAEANQTIATAPTGRKGRIRTEAVKVDGRKRAASATTGPVAASSAADEMADLLKLEEENRLLRKQLGDRLRAENVDLRNKLGV